MDNTPQENNQKKTNNKEKESWGVSLPGGALQEAIIEKIQSARSLWLTLKFLSCRQRLSRAKKEQKKQFEDLKSRFVETYKNLKEYELAPYINRELERVLPKLEKPFYPNPQFSFLANSFIKYIMFLSRGGKVMKEELALLEKSYPSEKLKELLIEDYLGNPLLMNAKYLTSHNSIHQLYHFTRYQSETRDDFEQFRFVVEWGGGYGSLAKIYHRLVQNPVTYIIFDIPLFSCVQWLYLSVTMGKDRVNLIQQPDQKIAERKINLVPVIFREQFKNLEADLFISTWAISESGRQAQDFVIKEANWFNARHLLLAYSNSSLTIPDSQRIEVPAKEKGTKIIDIEFLPGNHYGFV